MTSILILEDDADLREEVADYLISIGYVVHAVGSIRQFLNHVKTHMPDIAIVDRMLPDGDGLSAIGDLRRNGLRIGIIMFTAKNHEDDRMSGYALGVDHYLIKPIRMQEMGAIVASLSWRLQAYSSWQLMLNTWDLKTPTGQIIRLTAQETAFLRTLTQFKGAVVTRRKLLEGMGKNFLDYDPRNLDALLLRLRKKVANVTDEPFPIKTVHGMGYTALAGMMTSDN